MSARELALELADVDFGIGGAADGGDGDAGSDAPTQGTQHGDEEADAAAEADEPADDEAQADATFGDVEERAAASAGPMPVDAPNRQSARPDAADGHAPAAGAADAARGDESVAPTAERATPDAGGAGSARAQLRAAEADNIDAARGTSTSAAAPAAEAAEAAAAAAPAVADGAASGGGGERPQQELAAPRERGAVEHGVQPRSLGEQILESDVPTAQGGAGELAGVASARGAERLPLAKRLAARAAAVTPRLERLINGAAGDAQSASIGGGDARQAALAVAAACALLLAVCKLARRWAGARRPSTRRPGTARGGLLGHVAGGDAHKQV